MTRTASDGTFRFAELGPDTYSLLANGVGQASEERLLRLELGEVLEGIELQLSPAVSLSARLTIKGKSCTEARVTLSGTHSRYVEAKAKDLVLLDGLRLGAHELLLSCEGGLTQHETVKLKSGSKHQQWHCSPDITVRGLALPENGEPLAGARVRLRRIAIENGQSGVPPNTSGARPLPPNCGTATVTGEFECGGLSPGQFEFELEADRGPLGAPVQVEVVLGSQPEIRLQANALANLRVRRLQEHNDVEGPTSAVV